MEVEVSMLIRVTKTEECTEQEHKDYVDKLKNGNGVLELQDTFKSMLGCDEVHFYEISTSEKNN